MQQQVRERDEVQPGERLGETLIVARQTAKAGQPSEAALNHPTSGK